MAGGTRMLRCSVGARDARFPASPSATSWPAWVANGSMAGPKASGLHEYGMLASFRESRLDRIVDEPACAVWRLHVMQDGGMALPVSGRCSRQSGDKPMGIGRTL